MMTPAQLARLAAIIIGAPVAGILLALLIWTAGVWLWDVTARGRRLDRTRR